MLFHLLYMAIINVTTNDLYAPVDNGDLHNWTLEFWIRQAGQPIENRMTILSNGDVNIGGGPIG